MDIWTKKKRSQVMSRIRGKNTRPEKLVKSALRILGYTYRGHVKNMPGCPDIVLPKLKAVIFVNGCFWHQHSRCKRSGIPVSRATAFWKKKFEANAIRLRRQRRALRRQGWSVFTIWECRINGRVSKTKNIINVVKAIVHRIRNRNESRNTKQ